MHRDRLSELPLSLIHHILSFLPIKDVVKTTLLSKHWVNLWTTVPCLAICQDDEVDVDEWDPVANTERFRNFVNWALRLWKGTKIQKFCINIIDSSLYNGMLIRSLGHDVRDWTLLALKHGVEELEISAFLEYSVPRDLYFCSSIRRLSISNCDVEFHGTPSWNQLKSLSLQIIFDDHIEDLVSRIMLGSPVLEVFELDIEVNKYANLDIMSRSLKKVKIKNYVEFVDDESYLNTLSICCPNLETLEVKGLYKCLFTDVSSLTSATLDFFSIGNCDDGLLIEFVGETMKQICSTIQNVEKLALTGLSVQACGASCQKYLLSPLPNVMFLELDVLGLHIEFSDMIDLLGIFPSLKSVKINGLAFRKRSVFNTGKYMEFETTISKSFLLQLKIVEITTHSSDSSISGFIEFLLKRAVMLEKLVIWRKGILLKQHKRFLETLLSIPRSSPTARVILKSN